MSKSKSEMAEGRGPKHIFFHLLINKLELDDGLVVSDDVQIEALRFFNNLYNKYDGEGGRSNEWFGVLLMVRLEMNWRDLFQKK